MRSDEIVTVNKKCTINIQEEKTDETYGIRKNIRTIIRRTSDLVSSGELPNEIGPLTYSNLITDDITEYFKSDTTISAKLSTLCNQLKSKGIIMKKITRRKQRLYLFKLGPTLQTITWKNETKTISLDSIKDIRIGEMASNYREEYGIEEQFSGLWLTLIYNISKNKLKTLHLLARDAVEFNAFFNCIYGLVKSRRELMESISVPNNEQFANIHWHHTVSERKEDENNDTLSFEDVRRLCEKFHIYCSSAYLLKFFKLADVNHNSLLNFQEFQTFVKLLKQRQEISTIWTGLTEGKLKMDLQMFTEFLTNVQGESSTDMQIQDLFIEFSMANKGEYLTEEGFTKYLNSQPYLIELKEDYSKPLNHYFIASSHNTYLLGKQIAETPSVEGYIQVLQQGCRCVEIDIWDGDDGPVVCHGFLTPSIPLRNVLEAIRKYAFITSSYPLIISLELNCDKMNQKLASMVIKDTLGHMLYVDHGDSLSLPSPQELRHKIIIKAKKTKIRLGSRSPFSSSPIETTSSISSSYDSEFDSSSNAANPGVATINTETLKRRNSSSSITRIRRIGLKHNIKIIADVLEISGIHGIKFRNFSLPESKTCTHCFSINEKKFDSIRLDNSLNLSLDKHNRRYLMRIYPHALRYKSTNFNPIKFWSLGSQMVATNWQTNDLGQQINLAMFQFSNQRNTIFHSGYVLKPLALLSTVSKEKHIPALYEKLNKLTPLKKVIIKILSAQLLPNSKEVKNTTNKEENFGSSVLMEYISNDDLLDLHIVKNGIRTSTGEVRTIQCKENGFNPIWDSELQMLIRHLDFAFIRFTVIANGIPLATSCLKLSYLRRGYRHIPLYSMEGEQYIFSKLFIYTTIT